ncbi:MAG: hypothetical protein V1726_00275 [Methanobacteriota archaeon]
MEKIEKIFIKLELQKTQDTEDLQFTIIFDKNAPNFVTDNNMTRWHPTLKEVEFINEAFEMFGIEAKPGKTRMTEELSDTVHEHDVGDTVLLDDERDVVEKVLKKKKQL